MCFGVVQQAAALERGSKTVLLGVFNKMKLYYHIYYLESITYIERHMAASMYF